MLLDVHVLTPPPPCRPAGFKFTAGVEAGGFTWSNQTMFDWLTNPKKYTSHRATHAARIPVHSVLSAPLKLLHGVCCRYIKGTSMAFPGFKKEQDRADVVAYLNTCK